MNKTAIFFSFSTKNSAAVADKIKTAFGKDKIDTVSLDEVTEEQFFTQGESGGTVVSSAYRLALDIIGERFPPRDWNIYPFHFSDGDN